MEEITWTAKDEVELVRVERQLRSREKIAKKAGLITFGVIVLLFSAGILIALI